MLIFALIASRFSKSQRSIRRGIDQLDQGGEIPENQLDAYLAELKAKPE
jgi:hypothetical protein